MISLIEEFSFFYNELSQEKIEYSEISFTNESIEEFSLDTIVLEKSYLKERYENVKKIILDTESNGLSVDLFGVQKKDGFVYNEDSFVLRVYKENEYEDEFLFRKYNIKLMIPSMNKVYKYFTYKPFFDVSPYLSKNSIFIKEGGFGFNVNNYIGFYFISTNYEEVINFLNMPNPLPKNFNYLSAKNSLHPFGLTIDLKTKTPIKLTYYYCPDNKGRNIEEVFLRSI